MVTAAQHEQRQGLCGPSVCVTQHRITGTQWESLCSHSLCQLIILYLTHRVTLKVPINNYYCIENLYVVVMFVCVQCTTETVMQQLIILTTQITTAHCCHTDVYWAAQYSILLAVTTVLYLLPTPVVSSSIYSSPKCVWGVRTCVFIPGHVWPCAYLVWMWWRIDRAQLKWRALRCVQSKQWGANHGSTAFHRSHLIGYYQKADCHDGE